MAATGPAKTHILQGDPPVEVVLRRSARARRFSLRVSRNDGRVSLSIPTWAPEAEALAFLRERADWVRGHVSRAPSPMRPRVGGSLPLFGTPHPIIAGPGRAARLAGGALHVPDDARLPLRLRATLKTLARDRLADACDRHAAALGRPYGKITLRDPKSRWGSCSSKGDLMFSWRLVMAPHEVLDYVAAHEVAHLAEMNHSARFWSVCARLYPDHKRQRAWLRAHGSDLLAWRFDALPDDGGA